MRAIITVGLSFGDEGKGATVDALTRLLDADLVVRYSGGAQAGHNVQLADGRRHTFAQFGAGTLAGARTFLGPRMIIAPATMVPEAEHLQELGVTDPWSLLTVHPDCLVSTMYHVLMNRLRESARGAARHGSCGLGIGETRSYWLRHGSDAVVAADLLDRRTLTPKLALMRDRFLVEMQELGTLDDSLAAQLYGTAPAMEANVLMASAARLEIAHAMPPCHTAIFEGAQGVLLDEWKGFHPYTTWSTVTPLHALELLAELDCDRPLVLGITRGYATRHGAGPFPTWCRQMTANHLDPGNPKNRWQGAMRAGPLDLVTLQYAARFCQLDGIVLNGLDQLGAAPRMCREYQELDRLESPRSLADQQRLTRLLESATPVYRDTNEEGVIEAVEEISPVLAVAHGPTAADRDYYAEPTSFAGTSVITTKSTGRQIHKGRESEASYS